MLRTQSCYNSCRQPISVIGVVRSCQFISSILCRWDFPIMSSLVDIYFKSSRHFLPTAYSSANTYSTNPSLCIYNITMPVDEAAEPLHASMQALPRTRKSWNLSKSLNSVQRGDRRSENIGRPKTERRASSKSSQQSDALYMAPLKRSRKLDGSLSSIGNTRASQIDENHHSDLNGSEETELLSWNIIDREISEWQYTCRTGRPYWWSAESRQQPSMPEGEIFRGSSPAIWTRRLDSHLLPRYEHRRRSVSDSYLANPKSRQELASLIAVQLLGACFTLSPENLQHGNGIYLPKVPYLPLISSLRMHTQFRYSPCFGHQARDTSPSSIEQDSQGLFEYMSPLVSPPLGALSTGPQTPEIATSGNNTKRHRMRRTLHVTEESEGLSQVRSDPYLTSARVRQEDNPLHDCRRKLSARQSRQLRDSISVLCGSHSHETNIGSEAADGSTGEHQSHSRCARNTNYTLYPVIRSEPHPVFVQPVKEMVVKRWQGFRRRFGGSLHSPLLISDSEDLVPTPSDSELSGSCRSPASNDGKSRRRRARERGDIHSSSVDSTPHYNTPKSGVMSPRDDGAGLREMSTSQYFLPFQGHDQLSPRDSRRGKDESSISRSSLDIAANPPERPHACTSKSAPAIIDKTATQAECDGVVSPSLTFSPRHKRSRRRNRSMLSEVWTPDDIPEDASEDHGLDKSLNHTFRIHSPTSPASDVEGIEWPFPHPEDDANSMEHKSSRRKTRGPRPGRTSRSGSQIFKSAEDGVELNGLPVGPGKEAWDRPNDSHGNRRERSFL